MKSHKINNNHRMNMQLNLKLKVQGPMGPSFMLFCSAVGPSATSLGLGALSSKLEK